MKIFFFSFLLLLISYQSNAQAQIPKTIENFDMAFAIGAKNSTPLFSGAFSFNRTHGLLKSKKLRLGYGLRFIGFGSSGNVDYITAPYRLTKDPDKIDTLVVNKPTTLSLNASLHIEYIIIPRLKIGFNIDAVGIGFGQIRKDNNFISSNNSGQFEMTPFARPTTLNALLIGDRDWGQLGSEFFASFAIIPNKLWLRTGMNFTFSEYTTEQRLTDDNNRFRNKSLMGFLAISYAPFTK
jgi:hypothetical protein